MSDNYIQDALKRVAAMEKESLATITGSKVDAVNYWPYQQESFPYFVNRLGETTYDFMAYSPDITVYPIRIMATLVVDHLTAGYKGEKADLTYQYLVAVEDYFREHYDLTTASTGLYPNPPDYLMEVEGEIIRSHSGLVSIESTGIGVIQLGVVFTLELPFLRRQY